MSGLKLYLFGPPRLERDEVPVDLGRRKATALLAYLAVTRQCHSREVLADLFWPEHNSRQGRANLSRILSVLNITLGPGCLLADRDTLELNPEAGLWVDTAHFSGLLAACATHGHPETMVCVACLPSLAEAAALCQADFLAGFTLTNSVAWDEWQFFQTEGLRRELVGVLERLGRGYAGQGNWGRAIPYVRRWVELEPLHEPAHRQLMTLYMYNGQQAAALTQYETCRRILYDELGVEPTEETRSVYEQIRSGFRTSGTSMAVSPQPPAFLQEITERDVDQRSVFVARERQLAQLDEHLKAVLDGHGQVVFVIGEAGSGKTALVHEFSRLAQERYADLVVAGGTCNAYGGIGDPYLPFREILGLLTGDVQAKWAAGAIPQEQANRLWHLIPRSLQAVVDTGPDLVGSFISGSPLAARAAAVASGDVAWLIRVKQFLNVKTAGAASANLTQSALFEQYTQVLKALARQGPLLLVLDDLQWADKGSISLLFHMGRQLEGERILIVGVYRPADISLGRDGQRHPLAPVVSEFQRHLGNIQIDLRQTGDKQFVEAFLDTEPNRLGAEFREALYQHTRSHALFTVEMLRGMQERGDLVQDDLGRWIEGPAIDWRTLPKQVEAVIGERIGRLPAALREVLQVASVVGEDFPAEVVAQVLGINAQKIVRQLSNELGRQHRLVRSQGSLRLDPGVPRLSHYRFRHTLFQHYLYDSLDIVERNYLHQAVGEALERLYEGQTEQVAGQLARHFQPVGLAAKAVTYLHQAGKRATRLSANEEAIGHFTQALELLKILPDTPERTQQELALQVSLYAPLVATKGFGASEVHEACARARELCHQVGETPQLFPVLYGLWTFCLASAQFEVALELGQRCLRLAQRHQDSTLFPAALNALGATLFHLGEFAQAREHLEQGIASYDRKAHRSQTFLYGHDPAVSCLAYLATALWCLGYPDLALKRSQGALDMAQELSHPFSQAVAMNYAGVLYQLRRDGPATQEWAEAVINISTEHKFLFWLAAGTILRGWALAEQGQEIEGIAQIDKGWSAGQSLGAALSRPFFLTLLAEVHGRIGQPATGLTQIAEAVDLVSKSGERWWEVDLYRLKGELMLLQGEAEATVESCFWQAINTARRQGAKSLELRAAMSLSRLWQGQGKKEEARQILAEVYGWFTEGFDTSDLKEAEVLLGALA